MNEDDTFTVAIGEDKMVISKKVADVSQYFHNILTLGIDEEEVCIFLCRFKSIPLLLTRALLISF